MYETFYNECSLMKDRYLLFQLKWHNHCGLFVLEHNQELTTMGLDLSDPLTEKVVLVREHNGIDFAFPIPFPTRRVFVSCIQVLGFLGFTKRTGTSRIFKGYLLTFRRRSCIGNYVVFMLWQDWGKWFGWWKEKSYSTILQWLNSYTEEHIPDYLEYMDNGHMYFPCPEILPFLTAVDLSTRESAYEASFKNMELSCYMLFLLILKKPTT